jgi:hypothetical protein
MLAPSRCRRRHAAIVKAEAELVGLKETRNVAR